MHIKQLGNMYRLKLIVFGWLAVFLAGTLALGIGVPSAAAGGRLAESVPASSGKLVYIVPVHQTIESGLYSFMERAFEDAEKSNAAAIILEINTLGGRLDSAEQIGELIRSSKIPTTAFVNGKAVSAGSYIALNAGKIVMEPGSTIGAAAVVDGAGREIDSAKIVSHWVSEMRSAAELRGRNPDIAQKMVDKNFIVDLTQLGRKAGTGEILSLTADDALKVGYADKIVNSVQEAVEFAGLSGAKIIQFEPTFSEKLARFLVDPVVMTILLLIGLAGVAIELFVPGFGLPGIIGITGFALYFFGHYVAGFAGGEHIVLFIVGLVLLVIEIFAPSFGILGILGIISIISGVVLAAFDTESALYSLGISALLAIIVVAFFIKYFKKRGVWNKFILRDEMKTELGYVSHESKERLEGEFGTTVTPLRPAGTAMIGSERVDVVTEGEFIEKDRRVVVVKAEGMRVVVKEAPL